MALSHETQTPEQYAPVAENVATAFQHAHDTLYKITADPNFHATCIDNGIDPLDDAYTSAYWETFASYTHGRLEVIRAKNGNSLKLDALELMSSTPAYLLAQQALGAKTLRSSSETRHGVEITSYFNNQVREFATAHPTAQTQDVNRGLLVAAGLALEHSTQKHLASLQISAMLRGVQHELAFGQILSNTSRTFRPATMEEDLQGIDYVVGNSSQNPLYVNVKASLYSMSGSAGREDTSLPYGVVGPNQITMLSLASNSEFRGSFFLPEAVAAEKAPYLDALLYQAQQAAA